MTDNRIKTILGILIVPIAIGFFTAILTYKAYARQSGAIAVTIAPLHSLVAGVTQGVDKTVLIVPANKSPHDFDLRPSHIKEMYGAKAVFYIDENFESFITGALRLLPEKIRKFSVASGSGIRLEKSRRGGSWESDEHDHGKYNLHIWLSLRNAEKIVRNVTKQMSQISPQNKNAYNTNARNTIKKLRTLDEKFEREFAGMENAPLAVFHDAYGYFERDYGLNIVGSITTSPAMSQSARTLKEIRARIRKSRAGCVFSEPQFKDKLVLAAVEGTDAKIVPLDPIGVGIEPGTGLYFEMMENLARTIKTCLETGKR